MIGATFCSGIGAPEVAAPWVDWRLASEIETFPREVLERRLGYRAPGDHNQGDPLLWGDMTEINPDLLRECGVPLPDLIVAGTPCQAFSVAGLRKGLEDPRGNLTLAFVEICHAIQSARPDGKLIVLWENVPGVLSDKGNAFGAFLGGMVGAMDAIPSPDGGSWPREGMVEGPRARAAWAVLDAQWFGVAQRRRRVFVVFDFGGAVDPAAVLFERDSLRGDTPPSRETGEEIACGAGSGATGSHWDGAGVHPSLNQSHNTGGIGASNQELFSQRGSGLVPTWPAEIAPTLNSHFGDKMGLEDQHALSGAGMFVPAVAMCLNAGGMSRQDPETETLIPTSGGVFDVAHTLSATGRASEDGTGRGIPLVPVAFDVVAFGAQNSAQQGLSASTHHAPTLDKSKIPAVAFDLRGREGGAMPEGPHDTANIRAASGGSSRSYIAQPWAVRRLSPRECERLQGFPDDWTLIERPRRRTLKSIEDELAYLRQEYPGITEDEAIMLAADGPRYKALGNSMAVPVIRWIMDRIRISAA